MSPLPEMSRNAENVLKQSSHSHSKNSIGKGLAKKGMQIISVGAADNDSTSHFKSKYPASLIELNRTESTEGDLNKQSSANKQTQ